MSHGKLLFIFLIKSISLCVLISALFSIIRFLYPTLLACHPEHGEGLPNKILRHHRDDGASSYARFS
ncbi:exported protein of unknown function [Legionella fallonii LLAP-10]|uniref:Uncharacterized protein n=1 Tax=Legionella fallonii LLAP-10 TaxID=1212491 RepID=A0A098G1L4_9GAMM|nr:exported protein of unknown function [Legionella fallonii LLAP-10]